MSELARVVRENDPPASSRSQCSENIYDLYSPLKYNFTLIGVLIYVSTTSGYVNHVFKEVKKPDVLTTSPFA